MEKKKKGMQELELGKGMVKLKQILLQQLEQVRNNIWILWGCNHIQTSHKGCLTTKERVKIGEIFVFYYLKPWRS
jgi:hypothetical protein